MPFHTVLLNICSHVSYFMQVEVPSNLQPAGEPERVPGGKGRAVKLQAGQYLKVTNTHGEQVRIQHTCPDWALHCLVAAEGSCMAGALDRVA